ncbi:transposase [Paenibacillus sp. FSL R7-0048]|nr:transposase [Paenibacillus odorifer]
MFSCPSCGAACKAYDAEKKVSSGFLELENLYARPCPSDQLHKLHKVTLVPVKWSRPLSHLTLQFDAWAMRLMAEMLVNAAARELREHNTRMCLIFHYYVYVAMNELDLTGMKRIAVDETSSRRGHRYITLFVDVDTKTVLFANEGKGKETLETFEAFRNSSLRLRVPLISFKS